MNAPLEHGLRAHAFLSCSSSDRWLNCTVAPSLEAKHKDESSPFAAEGTLAHELAERCLRAGRAAAEIKGDYPAEMRDYVQTYVDYVLSIKGELLVEQRLDISRWVPDCFGTSDAVVLLDGVCHIIDLKYGKGVKVFAEQNTQLMLYALGAYDAYDSIYGPLTDFEIHIVQPRLDHIDSWRIKA